MDGKEINRLPLVGEFNTNYFVEDNSGLALLRVPKENRDLFENIIDEYRVIGFTGDGGRVSRRSVEEQFEFGRKAAESGLLVLPPISLEGKTVKYPFLEDAKTLDVYFQQHGIDPDEVVFQIVRDLKKAHLKGFVYGDRWAGNMLGDPKYGFVHIDFDLEISGPNARELDVAQVAYHTLWAGKERVLPILASLLGKERNWFNNDIIKKYIGGLARHLRNTKVGGMENLTEIFIETMQAVREKYD